ncbi:RNA-directed DNA polymerase from mobile element jockey [Trichonephila clavipes]|nr:RNA-directed DNA polymerase from mobile element jockey [Trichonephila clavipes]
MEDSGCVVPILKPGKNSAVAESYRPISLLPVLSKLAEKVILARVNDHLERDKILIPEQHGLRPRLSTSHQLLRVVEFIKEGNKKDECTAAVFLDIQKAFDRALQPVLQRTFAMPSIMDSHDMGLRTILQSRCLKRNAYSRRQSISSLNWPVPPMIPR